MNRFKLSMFRLLLVVVVLLGIGFEQSWANFVGVTCYQERPELMTGRSGDLALGEGYWFLVKDAQTGKEFVTRNGSFTINSEGFFITEAGYVLQGYENVTSYPFYIGVWKDQQMFFKRVECESMEFFENFEKGGLSVEYFVYHNKGIYIDPSVPGTITAEEIESLSPFAVGFGFSANGELSVHLSNGDSFVQGQLKVLYIEGEDCLKEVSPGVYSFDQCEGVSHVGRDDMELSVGYLNQGVLSPLNSLKDLGDIDLRQEASGEVALYVKGKLVGYARIDQFDGNYSMSITRLVP